MEEQFLIIILKNLNQKNITDISIMFVTMFIV